MTKKQLVNEVQRLSKQLSAQELNTKTAERRVECLSRERAALQATIEQVGGHRTKLEEQLQLKARDLKDLKDRHERVMDVLATILVHHGGVLAVRKRASGFNPLIQMMDDPKLNVTILTI